MGKWESEGTREEGMGERRGERRRGETSQFARCRLPERNLTSQPPSRTTCAHHARSRSFTPGSCTPARTASSIRGDPAVFDGLLQAPSTHAHAQSYARSSTHPPTQPAPMQPNAPADAVAMRVRLHLVPIPARNHSPTIPMCYPPSPTHSPIPMCARQRSPAPRPTADMSEDQVSSPAAYNPRRPVKSLAECS
ncbi:hypothetical protein FIBSPDRAFT_28231 [Athelia psychrophila]|uniref:Uncharacterized protein n=1 Tax=Athelia psychrophila TaxID=1759441 RepID=A0A166G745_9AGAM|nr:hypothetical protein FIBSPDRAFT_569399 [Fibularhizoctonia sp. CBS 109695]KZP17531.1 hypothetical protein FIBSPDRAFT_28231 [Fibularhizoctonia sp. CBS 109695]